MAKANATPTTIPTPTVERLRAEALKLADQCGRSVDSAEQFRLSEQALAAWQAARRLEQTGRRQ
jgi:hypothetical protein